MHSRVRSAVEKNAEYHEALADGYDRLINEASGGKKDHKADPNLAYLAKLHGEAAKQLRDVIGADQPPVIGQAVANRKIRRQRTGRLN